MSSASNVLKILFVFFGYTYAETVTVHTSLGPIQGEVNETQSGLRINCFKGIPYAKPPIGELRFAKPVAVEAWTEPLNATEWGYRCFAQSLSKTRANRETYTGVGIENEDCLNLNIFAPKEKSEKFPNGYPVMFWLYGGGFLLGGTQEYGIPEELISKEVIFVSVNYRTSILGFFATEEGTANFGLWDQTLALKWVKDHIGSFGGDASRITVFGQSAGGSSVSILTISPHSSGLFQNAIPQSGGIKNMFSVRVGAERDPVFSYCSQIAQKVGCTGKSRVILDCLRKQPIDDLQKAQSDVYWLKPEMFRIGPVWDGEFFPKDLDTLMEEAPKKPTMAGVMDLEGIIFAIPLNPGGGGEYIAKNFDTFNFTDFQQMLDVLATDQHFKYPDLVKRLIILQFLDNLGSRADRDFLLRQWAEIVGDRIFVREIVKENLARTKLDWPVWFYKFKYYNPVIYPERFRFEGISSSHGQDVTYVFGHPVYSPPFPFDENDEKVAESVTTLWTNFAKYSDPTATPVDGVIWNRTTIDNPHQYLEINPQLKMNNYYRREMGAFWYSLIPDIEKIKFESPTQTPTPSSAHTSTAMLKNLLVFGHVVYKYFGIG